MLKGRKKTVYQNLYYMALNEYDNEVIGLDDFAEETGQGNYVEKELIGQGAKKKVYRSFDTKCNRYVALAELQDEYSDEDCESFIREAKLTAALVHPNIISVHDIGHYSDGTPYFTMELKIGQSLREMIKDTCLISKEGYTVNQTNQLLDIFLKVCDAVEYAHSRGVLHLDLKPDNIQVGEFGEVQVCDWGLGTILEDVVSKEDATRTLDPDQLNSNTLTGYVQGSPGFMAPEQITHDFPIRESADIYSMGILLYTLIEGSPPLQGTVKTLIAETAAGSVFKSPKFRGIRPDVSESLVAIIRKAVAFKPDERYGSVEVLKNDVAAYLSLRMTSVESCSMFRQFILFWRRNSVACFLISCFMLILAVVSILFINSLNAKIDQLAEEKQRSDLLRLEAIGEKEQAKELLSLYEQEQDFTNEYFSELKGELKKDIYSFIQREVFYTPLETLEKAELFLKKVINNYPAERWAYKRLAFVYFWQHKFQEAEKHFSSGPDATYTLLAKEYKSLVKVNGPLEVEDFFSLIDQLGSIGSIRQAIIMVKYSYSKYKSTNAHCRLVSHLAQKLNPHWQGRVIYDSDDKELIVTGKNLKFLGMSNVKNERSGRGGPNFISLIDQFLVKKLIVSDTSIVSAEHLIMPGVVAVDIRNTPIDDLVFLNRIETLEEVIVAEGQFNEKELAKLRDGITILKR